MFTGIGVSVTCVMCHLQIYLHVLKTKMMILLSNYIFIYTGF